MLAEHEPDEVVVATGSLPWAPECICMSDSRVVTAENILQCDRIRPGRYLVVGGGLVGLETAEYLAERGAEVTVVEMLDQMGAGLGPIRLKLMLDRLIKAGVNLLTKTRVIAVQGRLAPGGNGRQGAYAGPLRGGGGGRGLPLQPDSSAAFGEGVKVQVIGDACRARSIVEAIGEGLDAALNIGK